MLKNLLTKLIIVILILGFTGNVHALLFDRGGGLIYDSDQDLTWLQDANYAQTSGFDANGLMNWSTAVSWADGLVFGGFTDWRLPSITDNGNNGCNFSFGGTDCGWNVDPLGSEMAYMFHNNLGNDSWFDVSGNPTGCTRSQPVCLKNTGPFSNVKTYWYWSGTEVATNNNNAWAFAFANGHQNVGDKNENNLTNVFRAWAVRSGDVVPSVPVPEPETMFLLGTGLLGLVLYRGKLHL